VKEEQRAPGAGGAGGKGGTIHDPSGDHRGGRGTRGWRQWRAAVQVFCTTPPVQAGGGGPQKQPPEAKIVLNSLPEFRPESTGKKPGIDTNRIRKKMENIHLEWDGAVKCHLRMYR
jgi:hypothetical protein